MVLKNQGPKPPLKYTAKKPKKPKKLEGGAPRTRANPKPEESEKYLKLEDEELVDFFKEYPYLEGKIKPEKITMDKDRKREGSKLGPIRIGPDKDGNIKSYKPSELRRLNEQFRRESEEGNVGKQSSGTAPQTPGTSEVQTPKVQTSVIQTPGTSVPPKTPALQTPAGSIYSNTPFSELEDIANIIQTPPLPPRKLFPETPASETPASTLPGFTGDPNGGQNEKNAKHLQNETNESIMEQGKISDADIKKFQDEIKSIRNLIANISKPERRIVSYGDEGKYMTLADISKELLSDLGQDAAEGNISKKEISEFLPKLESLRFIIETDESFKKPLSPEDKTKKEDSDIKKYRKLIKAASKDEAIDKLKDFLENNKSPDPKVTPPGLLPQGYKPKDGTNKAPEVPAAQTPEGTETEGTEPTEGTDAGGTEPTATPEETQAGTAAEIPPPSYEEATAAERPSYEEANLDGRTTNQLFNQINGFGANIPNGSLAEQRQRGGAGPYNPHVNRAAAPSPRVGRNFQVPNARVGPPAATTWSGMTSRMNQGQFLDYLEGIDPNAMSNEFRGTTRLSMRDALLQKYINDVSDYNSRLSLGLSDAPEVLLVTPQYTVPDNHRLIDRGAPVFSNPYLDRKKYFGGLKYDPRFLRSKFATASEPLVDAGKEKFNTMMSMDNPRKKKKKSTRMT